MKPSAHQRSARARAASAAAAAARDHYARALLLACSFILVWPYAIVPLTNLVPLLRRISCRTGACALQRLDQCCRAARRRRDSPVSRCRQSVYLSHIHVRCMYRYSHKLGFDWRFSKMLSFRIRRFGANNKQCSARRGREPASFAQKIVGAIRCQCRRPQAWMRRPRLR